MIYDKSIKWKLYLSRPFSLFGASLWNEWYSSSTAKKIIGFNSPRGLFIESPRGMVKHYREETELDRFLGFFEELSKTNPKKAVKFLEKGVKLNKKTEALFKNNSFSFKKAVGHLKELTIYSTIAPYFIGNGLEKTEQPDKKIEGLVNILRAKSLYPKFIEEVIVPIAKKELENRKISQNLLQFLTYNEIIEKRFESAKLREQEAKKGFTFIYENLDGKENVSYVMNPKEIINSIEHINEEAVIKGKVAYSGIAKGKVRLVLTDDPEKAVFFDGEILVAIHTNPNILPLLKKAAAIITDEGGIASHAAILSRELKKPCVIGTKIATKLLKDGDYVEVDANKGVVRKL